MKLGFLTACFPEQSLTEVADVAVDMGFEALEVAAWPSSSRGRPFTATHIDVLEPSTFESVKGVFAERGLVLSSLAYYDNNLHPDPFERRKVNQHVFSCLEAAAELGCPTVGTFIGRDPGLSVIDNLAVAEKVFAPMVKRAGELGVRIVIENCVMEGWHPDGYPGNLAYCPELWDWLIGIGLYLNFDPSHLMWIGIDPVRVLRQYVDKVAHVQAKDIELFPGKRDSYGYFGKTVSRADPWDVGWWRYRVPGRGQVDWPKLVDVLYEYGFEGVVSVEHEDPVWGGDPGRVTTGLRIAYDTLRPLIVPCSQVSGGKDATTGRPA
ncbi:MAG: sugar phosphate isomerase/epimerase [Actinobacteria bacterium]|nr:sugar phosphate isomerase/epimerase [Actinomycetota bacterium]